MIINDRKVLVCEAFTAVGKCVDKISKMEMENCIVTHFTVRVWKVAQ